MIGVRRLQEGGQPTSLDEFVPWAQRERPATLSASEVAGVRPNPWVLRAGSGKDARIRMSLGMVRYERAPGDAVWNRVDGNTSDFDVMDDGAA